MDGRESWVGTCGTIGLREKAALGEVMERCWRQTKCMRTASSDLWCGDVVRLSSVRFSSFTISTPI